MPKVRVEHVPVRRLLPLLLLPALLSCNGDGEGGAATTTAPPETTTSVATTTTVAPDPFSVPEDPADIDAAYIEAVLAELERINGDALRLAVSEGLSPTISELLQSIYTPELFATEIQIISDLAGAGFEGVSPNPGDVRVSVDSVLSARSDCISADAIEDFSEIGPGGLAAARTRVELRRPPEPSNPNRTPWVYALRQPLDGPSPMPEPCANS
jgi:hypothetical protein